MDRAHLKQRALSGVRWTVSARIGVQLVTWPATIYVMRLLDPHDYGLVALAGVVIGFIGLFGELGLGAGLVQSDDVRPQVLRTAAGLIGAVNVIIALVLVAAAPWVAQFFDEQGLTAVIRVLALGLLFNAISAVPQAMLERQLRFREVSIVVVAANLAASASTIAAALLGWGVWALVLGSLVLGAMRAVLVSTFYRQVVWPNLSAGLAPVRSMIRFSSHVVGSRFLWYWYGQADMTILGRILPSSIIGNYSVASELALLPVGKAMEAVNKVSFPALSRLRIDSEQFGSTYQRLLSLLAVYAFAVCWGLAGVADELVPVVLGEKWNLAITPLMLLSLAAPFRMLCSFQNTVTTAAGKPQAATKELALSSAVIPGAILVGALHSGINGAAAAWVVAFPLMYVLSTYLTTQALELPILAGLKPAAMPVLAGALMLAAVRGSGTLAARTLDSPIFTLCVEIGCGAVTYLAVLWVLSPRVLQDGRNLVSDLVRPRRAAST